MVIAEIDAFVKLNPLIITVETNNSNTASIGIIPSLSWFGTNFAIYWKYTIDNVPIYVTIDGNDLASILAI